MVPEQHTSQLEMEHTLAENNLDYIYNEVEQKPICKLFPVIHFR